MFELDNLRIHRVKTRSFLSSEINTYVYTHRHTCEWAKRQNRLTAPELLHTIVETSCELKGPTRSEQS